MKKVMIVSVGMIILFLYFGVADSQDVKSEISEAFIKSEIRNAFSERQEAFKKNDYETIWKYWPELEKGISFKNDIREMETWTKDLSAEDVKTVYDEKIASITLISPERAFVETTPPSQFKGYYLVKEEGNWKFTSCQRRNNLVIYRLGIISGQIKDFYKENQRLPSDIEEIIKFSPELENYVYDIYDGGKKPYRFSVSDGEWKLYSLGPDGDDDKGKILYDQTQGLISDGDIVLAGEISQ
ncbi:MAG: hypothetical protein ABIH40_01110 [Candidatus Omnitrophota bacterium]